MPQVGDFVATDEPLFALYGATATIDDRDLRATVAMGAERTLEQDPMFAFRILVDIALKALSPAINDPTTAVLAIDQVHRLLRFLGKHQLRGEVICDDAGAPRVIFRTPNWEDFVHVACTEIRACGASNVQVARRMRAMLEDVGRVLPEYRLPSIETELDAPRPRDRVVVPDSRGPRARSLPGRSGSRGIACPASRLTRAHRCR